MHQAAAGSADERSIGRSSCGGLPTWPIVMFGCNSITFILQYAKTAVMLWPFQSTAMPMALEAASCTCTPSIASMLQHILCNSLIVNLYCNSKKLWGHIGSDLTPGLQLRWFPLPLALCCLSCCNLSKASEIVFPRADLVVSSLVVVGSVV